MSPYEDAIAMMVQRERMSATSEYDSVKPTPSSMYDTSAHVIEYKTYWLSMSVVFTIKDILGLSIFVFGGNNKCENGALNVVYLLLPPNTKILIP